MSEINFIADVMLGKLARWLRILGFDVIYSNTLDDDEIIRLAELENRIILTRDTRLVARRFQARSLFIESNDSREQVRQVVRALELADFKVFSRCLECNTLLREVDKEAVFEKVPPFVYLTQNRFAICPTCDRVYWRGTHADEMLKRLPIQL
jgi:uncharacterized protein with PIN domain